MNRDICRNLRKTAIFALTVLFALTSVCFAKEPVEKLGALSNRQLTSLVKDLDAFYKKSLDILFEVNQDESERELGLRVGERLFAEYDHRVNGRCSKSLISQALNQYILVAHARMSNEENANRAQEVAERYSELLKKYGLTPYDLRQTGQCTVFEYDLEPLYESPITVADPGWWIFNQKRQKKTYIRIYTRKHRADGLIDIEAYIPVGRPRGVYVGVAKRQLNSATIEISLMRKGSPLLIDGELTMTGAAYKDPVTNEHAPKMPARVLSGMLTIHDGNKFSINNAVMMLARDSNDRIGKALGGFKVPTSAAYGSYLNIVVVSFRGVGMSRDYMKYAGLIDEVYNRAQKDNPIRSFHPTRKPLFVNDDEAAFVIIDIASDVNANAVRVMRSRKFAEKANELGAGTVAVFPFYKVKDGKLRVKLSGRKATELKFKGFEGLAKALFTMYAGLNQEQQLLFERFGIKKLSNEILVMQREVAGLFNAMGPALDLLLKDEEFNSELDAALLEAMKKMATLRDELQLKLSTILDTRRTYSLRKLYAQYIEQQRQVFELVLAALPNEKAQTHADLVSRFEDGTKKMEKRVERFSKAIGKKQDEIEACLNYMNLFSVRIQLSGEYVDRAGKLKKFTWTWERTLPRELDLFFNGGKYDEEYSRGSGRKGS